MRFGKLIGFGIWSVVLSGLGFFFYQMHESGRTERELRERVARLMTRERVARIYVAKIEPAQGSEPARTHIRWTEEGAVGVPPGGRELTLPGREIHVKALQIIFDPQKTAEGDPLRGKSLNLFSRDLQRGDGAEERPSPRLPRERTGTPRPTSSKPASGRSSSSS